MNASERFAQICRISTIINDLNMMGITITVVQILMSIN